MGVFLTFVELSLSFLEPQRAPHLEFEQKIYGLNTKTSTDPKLGFVVEPPQLLSQDAVVPPFINTDSALGVFLKVLDLTLRFLGPQKAPHLDFK